MPGSELALSLFLITRCSLVFTNRPRLYRQQHGPRRTLSKSLKGSFLSLDE
jgi:hypothetical protein